MDSDTDTRAIEAAQGEPDYKDFTEYTSYEEDDSLVVCDRSNPNEWVKSDVSMAIEE